MDLFVPQYLEGLEHYKQTGKKIAKHGKIFFHAGHLCYLHNILKELHEKHGIHHTPIKYDNIRNDHLVKSRRLYSCSSDQTKSPQRHGVSHQNSLQNITWLLHIHT